MTDDTHIERINGTNSQGGESALREKTMALVRAANELAEVVQAQEATAFAHPDHPRGERRMYRTTAKAYIDGAIQQAGAHQLLLPEEVGPHHVYVPPKDAEPAPAPEGAEEPASAA